MRYFAIATILLIDILYVKCQDVIKLNNLIKECVYVGDCHNGHILIKDADGYDFIDVCRMKKTSFHFSSAKDFNEGLAWVKTRDGWCIMDTCENIVPTPYVSVQSFKNDLALVSTNVGENVFVNSKGIIDLTSDFVKAKPFNEGLAAASKSGKWGFIDKNGTWVIPPLYYDAQSFCEGYAPVKDEEGWIFINYDGIPLMKKHFKYVSQFHNGAAVVQESQSAMKEVLLEDTSIVYASVGITPFSNNYAIYKKLASSSIKGKYGYLKYDSIYSPLLKFGMTESYNLENGQTRKLFTNSRVFTAIPPLYDAAQPYSEGYFPVCKEGKWTYLNQDGIQLCDFSFDAAYPFSEGIARIKEDGFYKFIDENGEGISEKNKCVNKDYILTNAIAQLNCLKEDGQREILMNEGEHILNLWLKPSKLTDISCHQIFSLLQIINMTSYAQNTLMSLALSIRHKQKLSTLFDDYRKVQIPKYLSYQQGQFSLNMENYEKIYKEWIMNSYKDSLYSLLALFVDRMEYKRAVISFEAIVKSKNLGQMSYEELLVYLYLLNMAGDFERANNVIVALSQRDIESLEIQDYDKAVCLADVRRFDSAYSLFKKIIEDSTKSQNRHLVGQCLHNIAMMYNAVGCEMEAEEYMKKAINEYRCTNANKVMLDALAWLLSNTKTMAGDEFCTYLSLYKEEEMKYEAEAFQVYDMGILRTIWGQGKNRINSVLNNIIRLNDEKTFPLAYELSLFSKNFILDTQCLWQQKAMDINNDETKKMLMQYEQLRSQFRGVDIFNLNSNEQFFNAHPIYETEQQIKKDILSHCPSYINVSIYDCIESIFDYMQNDDISVDFFDYVTTDHSDCTAAWVLYKGKIELVDNVPTDSTVWNVVLKQKEVKKIYFSTSASNETKGLEFYPIDQRSTPIAFSREVHRVTSIRLIPNIDTDKHHIDSLYLYGGLDYGYSFSSENRGVGETGFLEYSLKEIDDIADIMSPYVKIKRFVEKEGTVQKFLDTDYSSFSCIHLATHGWQITKNIDISNFFGYDRFNYYRQNTDLENEDWLLNSTGLYMSSDDTLSDSICNILLAKDIAVRNLKNTMLVVLSACSTISGSDSDGYASVLGLNYALQRASVGNIISSVRDVDDEKTYELMCGFYEKLLTCDIHKAFWGAVKAMWNKYPNTLEYWTSFILLENPVKVIQTNK